MTRAGRQDTQTGQAREARGGASPREGRYDPVLASPWLCRVKDGHAPRISGVVLS